MMKVNIPSQPRSMNALWVSSLLISVAAGLPRVQVLPTVERPFVFMHLVGCSLLFVMIISKPQRMMFLLRLSPRQALPVPFAITGASPGELDQKTIAIAAGLCCRQKLMDSHCGDMSEKVQSCESP